MNDNKLTKQVCSSLVELSRQEFNTWATDAFKLVNGLGLSGKCKQAAKHNIISTYLDNLQNTQLYPILRTYKTLKHNYAMEPYLYLVKKHKYRQAIAKFRRSSHTLEIERGLHTNPKKNHVADRKCLFCELALEPLHFT